ncbi:MAG: glycosyl hydrolase [Verrucomicrobiia bacterium]
MSFLNAVLAVPDGISDIPSPPQGAIGFPNREENFDLLPGFKNPPPGYGEVAFYWWLGDPLTKERLQWQIEQLAKARGVMGLQINYAHSDRGGRSYGLTYPSQPPLFSEEWWNLVGWFIKTAKEYGMSVSLSDYTLGIGQGWIIDEILKENPYLNGAELRCDTKEVKGNIVWTLPQETLYVCAYKIRDTKLSDETKIDLRRFVQKNVLNWTAPSDDKYKVVAIYAHTVVPSLDPMNPKSGELYAKRFFGQFEERFPQEGGKGLNFFFSDELDFGVRGKLWTKRFAEEFRRLKGYDLIPELPALFFNTGAKAIKIRLDYNDVKVALTEEGFFKPVFEWHQKRGMIYGCDHGGRGRDVTEFGDYFRTQRWNQGPGCDQPGLSRDIIKNKVASSIAHLYLRPRVWLEGYYGSGWGTTSEQIIDATFANFAQGQNLLTFHGLYYSTHGGWWEWAPPCNHFRQPYWKHMAPFMESLQRLSYILSQGYHRCDVAIIYPVAPVEAELGANEAVKTAFDSGVALYKNGIDFDFIDYQSLDRAAISENQLRVSGESYRVIVVPSMRAIRFSNLKKLLQFHRSGGLVVAVGALPEATDRVGSNDPQVDNIVEEIFAEGKNRFTSPTQLVDFVSRAFRRDFNLLTPQKNPVYFIHRKIGSRDIYFIYGAAKGTECELRSTGKVELWDIWTGNIIPLPVISQNGFLTRLKLPLTEKEAQLIVFSPGKPDILNNEPTTKEIVNNIEGDWEFEIEPALENRFGDYRLPPSDGFIGAEVRRFRYSDEKEFNPDWTKPDFDDSKWRRLTYSFGQKFWKLGPLPQNLNLTELEKRLSIAPAINPEEAVEINGKSYKWQPYDFSWRWGIENDPGHQGYHGLKGIVHDDLIGLGKLRFTATDTVYEPEGDETRYYLWTTVWLNSSESKEVYLESGGLLPAEFWINGQSYSQKLPRKLALNVGANTVLARYDRPGRGYFVFKTAAGKQLEDDIPFSSEAKWIWYPEQITSAERFFRRRFVLEEKPKKAVLRITCDNGYSVWINNQKIGSGNRWEVVDEYDITKQLRSGENIIAILARNEGDIAGLIAEIRFDANKRIYTDSGWLCTTGVENQEWTNLNFNEKNWTAAKEIAPFKTSIWYNHVHGPPKLQQPTNVENFPQPQLATRWYNDQTVLPFDVKPAEKNPSGWYRFTTAPGTTSLVVTCIGKPRIWIDGREVPGIQEREKNTFRFSPAQTIRRANKVALRIEQQRGEYGGAALLEPVKLECGTGVIAQGDWSRYDGLECYSGGAYYRKIIHLNTSPEGRIILDLGRVVSSVELSVNGKQVGIRLSPPWKFDITKFVKQGENRIELLIYNTAANHYVTIPTRYRGATESGLIGPVKLITEEIIKSF